VTTLAAAISIIGISRRRAKGDQAASTSSAAPAIIRSNIWPSSAAPVAPAFVIAADARPIIATMTNFARITAMRNSTSRRAYRLVAGQIIPTKVSGTKKSAM
jgi:hypothetical protein